MGAAPSTFSGRVGIAGAGLLGRLLAWQLLRQGCSVSLFEAGPLTGNPSAAGYTAAGMIAPLSEAVATERLAYDMGMASLALWPQWLAALGQAPVHYAQNGSLVIAHSQDQAELRQFEQDLRSMLGASARYQALDHGALAALEPDLASHFRSGLYLPDEAHIDNRHLLDVLLQESQRLGLSSFEHTPVTTHPQQIKTDSATYTFDLVLDCRGQGAKPQWSEVRGVRGEVLAVQTPDVHLSRPVRLMHPRYQLYVVPKPNQHFVIGATQIESEDRSPVSLQSLLELSSALYTISPAFAEARVIETAVNLRPALMDNRPRIQAEAGLVRVNGLFRHGYLLAPVVVQHLLNWLNHENTLPFADVLGLEELSFA